MIYLLKSRQKGENRPRNILIVCVFFLLFILSFIFPNFSRGVFVGFSRPIWAIGDTTKNGFENVYNFFSLQKNLVNENKNLKDQIDALNLKVIDYDAVTKQNTDLKNLLGRSASSNSVVSRVISEPPQSPYDTLVIDVGSSDGIILGDKVYISDSIIIGEITSVTPHTSLVEMFSTGDKKTESVLERTGASYELSGRGGANFSVDVPKDADILWGDTFTIPGLSSSVLGSVYYIDTNSQSAFKTVFIRIPGNVFQTKWVFVQKL